MYLAICFLILSTLNCIKSKSFENEINQNSTSLRYLQSVVFMPNSGPLGGKGGTFFMDTIPSNVDINKLRVKKVLIKSGNFIDSIQLYIGDDTRNYYTNSHGGNGGVYQEWIVPEGQYITQVEVKSASLIDSLTFITNTLEKSPQFGGGGGSYKLVSLLPRHLIGLAGRSGQFLETIQFITI
jgi:hypothetical protein